MLAAYPSLQNMYKTGDGNTQIFALEHGFHILGSRKIWVNSLAINPARVRVRMFMVPRPF